MMMHNSMPSESYNGFSDGIVLLGGSYLERVPKVAELYGKCYAPLILLANDGVRSGWSTWHQRNLYSIERSEELLVHLGVPRDSIVQLPYINSGTIFDALAVRRYAIKNGLKSLHLVTTDYHAYRALWIFKRVFKEESVSISITPATSPLFSLSSSIEPFKLIYYWLRFGVMNNFPKH